MTIIHTLRQSLQRTSLILALATLGLGGCGDGVSTQSLQNIGQTQTLGYQGPPASSEDVRTFQNTLWESLRGNDRCGGCHHQGGQTPDFVRQDDVNLAYQIALGLVDTQDPANSRIVAKVAGGHHCWLASTSACAATMTAYIQAWLQRDQASATQVQLTAPPSKTAGNSKSWPGSSALFAQNVHPLLKSHCAGCHTAASATPQAPFFASMDADIAYEAVRTSQKIDLVSPANSRLVVRLRDEFHNCWSASCQSDAADMLGVITAFANGVPLTTLPPQTIVSKALKLGDGIVASGGKRHDSAVIAKYEFKDGKGDMIYDTSGVDPALNLRLGGKEDTDFKWVGGWGVELTSSMAKGDSVASKKLADRIKATGEYSLEAWVVPGNVSQEGPARIISYSASTTARNVTLGQVKYNYVLAHRSSTTSANGEPALSTPDAAELLKATLQHVVATFDPVNGRRLYVNGVLVDVMDAQAAGNLNDWNDTYSFALGAEIGGTKAWKGTLRMVAVHERALTPGQIYQNFVAGVGEKYFLLFNVSDWVNIPSSYILFEASQFDSYSYLFSKPTFISLDPTAQPAGIVIRGMRLGINGKEVAVGQSYVNLNASVGGAAYNAVTGQQLSRLGSVIAKDQDAANDEFFLTFEQFGSFTNVVTEPAPLQPATPADSPAVADIGLRTFEEINATMAVATGVDPQQSDVRKTYDTIRQQLPTLEAITGFVSAHQVAVAQLSIEYCNALVETPALRGSYFTGFDFSAAPSVAFASQSGRDLIIDPLLTHILGTGLASQPDADARSELNNLTTRLTTCGSNCAADRTRTVVKALCAATLGSAAMLVQ